MGDTPNKPLMPIPVLSPPSVQANAYLLIDFNSSKVLAAKNSDLRIEPASLTKIMTMYVVEHELKNKKIQLNDEVMISNKAWQTQGSRMFLNPGSKVTVDELIKGIVIQSGNDASVALAEHVAGSEDNFVLVMNQYAEYLGMKNTKFANSTGLPAANHYTTAADLAILAAAIIKDFPDSYKLYAEREFTYNNIKQVNRNKLLWQNNSVDGIKTGYTDTAGYCLVASAKERDMRLISIILGAKSEIARTIETNKLLTWGFRFYETYLINKSNEKIQDIRVWMGDNSKVAVGLSHDIYITIPRGQYNNLNMELTMPKAIKAPLKQGSAIGAYNIKLNNTTIATYPLVILSPVSKGTLWRRLKDRIELSFSSIVEKINSSILS